MHTNLPGMRMRVKRAYNAHTTGRRWTSLSYELFWTHLRSLCTSVCEKYVVQSLLQIKPKPFFCRAARFKKDLCCSRAKLCDWKAGPDFCLISQASWQAAQRGTAETPRALAGTACGGQLFSVHFYCPLDTASWKGRPLVCLYYRSVRSD